MSIPAKIILRMTKKSFANRHNLGSRTGLLPSDTVNKFINYIAASTTMVYLINEHPVVSVLYHNYLNELFEKSGTLVSFLVQSSILIIVSFGASIIYDRLRMNIYKGIQRLFNGCL